MSISIKVIYLKHLISTKRILKKHGGLNGS